MLSLFEAYQIIKACSNYPITNILETDYEYLSTTDDDYIGIDKVTGEVTHFYYITEFILRLKNEKYVDLDEMYTDFLEFYNRNNNESNLADLYARVWNTLFYHQKGELHDYKCKEDQQRMIKKWSDIEKLLYDNIRHIQDHEEIDYPPCVKNKFDDPFYRIKPFMLKNGYSDSSAKKTWVKV